MCTRGGNTAKRTLFLGRLLSSSAVAAAAVAITITRDDNNSGNSQTAAIKVSLTKKSPLSLEDNILLWTSLLEVMPTMVCFSIYLTLTKLVL